MCGLFGYIGKAANPDVLDAIATLARRRGPDGYGIWTPDEQVEACGSKAPLPRFQPTRLLIGHCRLRTGLSCGLRELQPLTSGGLVLAHNGAIENYYELAERLVLHTAIDSEALLALISQALGTLEERLRAALAQIDMGAAWALTLTNGGSALLANWNLDLYVREADNGVYWCSVEPDSGWEKLAGVRCYSLTGQPVYS